MNFDGKILLVDDERHVRRYLALILRGVLPGASIVEATNGEEAIELFARDRPKLVMMDVNMPIRDGISACEAILEIDPEVLVIMMTSLANRQTVEDAMRAGAAFYFRKDTPREEITGVLTQFVNDHFEE